MYEESKESGVHVYSKNQSQGGEMTQEIVT